MHLEIEVVFEPQRNSHKDSNESHERGGTVIPGYGKRNIEFVCAGMSERALNEGTMGRCHRKQPDGGVGPEEIVHALRQAIPVNAPPVIGVLILIIHLEKLPLAIET